MINSKDTKIIKTLVVSTLVDACNGLNKEYYQTKAKVERSFDIVIKEKKEWKI